MAKNIFEFLIVKLREICRKKIFGGIPCMEDIPLCDGTYHGRALMGDFGEMTFAPLDGFQLIWQFNDFDNKLADKILLPEKFLLGIKK